MIIELFQLIELLFNKKIHLLIIFFVFFTLWPVYLTRKRYMNNQKQRLINDKLGKNEDKDQNFKDEEQNLTVIVPVHLEDHDMFEKCISSISAEKPDQLIVSIDSDDERLINIAEKYSADIIKYSSRVGKRKALADAWLKAKNDIIVQCDSDIILEKGCLTNLIKPFSDKNVVGTSSEHICTNGGSFLSYMISYSIELSRTVNEIALNDNLIVADGRCNAWRKEYLLNLREEFLNEYWMNTKCEIGDDRFLSHNALKLGLKTRHADNAIVYTPAPDAFKKFLKQQIRWRRSGTKFWIKDLKEKIFPSKLYIYKCFTYYLSPFIFILVIILDMLFFNYYNYTYSIMNRIITSFEDMVIILIVGTTLVTALRQLIYFGKILFPKYIVVQSLIGLFLILPISIYGVLTIKRQDLWMTRTYIKDKKKD